MEQFAALLQRSGAAFKRCFTWFNSEWQPCIHLWCPAFYGHVFTRAFTTNNYVEGLNFALRSMLMLRPDLRVDSLWRVVVEDFTKKYIEMHAERNLLSSSTGVTFTKRTFPPEFGLRPLCILKALSERMDRGAMLDRQKMVCVDKERGMFKFIKGDRVLKSEYDFHVAQKRATAGRAHMPGEVATRGHM